uniref:Dynamin family protein n=1 Tax=Candidatus Caldatribacterium saccharofermentans TaxID=1454753 RepID=A0A7V4TII3_9BACT
MRQQEELVPKKAKDLSVLFEEAIKELEALGSEFENERKALSNLKERLLQERFHLAVLGQFKRGKSTFINALLGEEILPTAVLPLTAVPTFVLFGPRARVRVLFEEGKEETWEGEDPEELLRFLSQFVTEARNPENTRSVSQVEVSYPSPLLEAGVVLIDTPGIGSTLRHNTEATLNFLPQCDAAVFLLSTDPPVTEAEVEFLQSVRSKVAHLFFVLNKVDYLKEEEVTSLFSFIKDVLRKEAGIEGELPIFPVSARLALEGKKKNDPDLLHRSGIPKVVQYLLTFLAQEKRDTLQVALAKKAVDVLDNLVMHLRLVLRSLEMPLRDLDERLRIFTEKIREAERQRVQLGDLLSGERKRMVALLEEQAEHLRQKARTHLFTVVEQCLATQHTHPEEAIRTTLAEAIPAFFERELSEIASAFAKRVAEVLEPYEQKVQELVETVRRTASELFDIPYTSPKSSETFAMYRRPYWITHKWYTHFSFLPEGVLSALLPAKVRQAKIVRRIQQEIEELVTSNVENLRWATLQNLNQTFHQFSEALEEQLEKTIAATYGAIEKAHLRRVEKSQNLQAEIASLSAASRVFTELQAEFASFTQYRNL